MSDISFSLKDMTRRKQQTALTALGLTIATTTTLFSYLILSVSGQQHEFGIIRVVGAKQKKNNENRFFSSLSNHLVSGAIGVCVGLFITFWFLIPDPVI